MTGRSEAVRLDALTGVRGIAAWFVVLYHIRYSLVGVLPPGAILALGKGYLAVDFFFMLSGFVLWLGYAAPLGKGDPAAAARFWWRRIARIWPLHLVVLAGFVALAAAFALTGRDTANYPLGELPLHVMLVQNWGFTRDLAWNHPAWSISAELAAYLLFPALALSERWRPSSALLLLLAGLLLAANWAWFHFHGKSGLGADITRLGLMRCLLEFTAGSVAARLWQGWNPSPRRGLISGVLACGCAAVLATGAGAGLSETAFVPAAMFTALLALALARGHAARLLGTGAVLWLGEVSYSTYLAHFGLFIVFKLLFVDSSLQLGPAELAGFVAALLTASALLYRFVEKPAQRWMLVRMGGPARPAPA